MAFLLDTSILGRLANSADKSHAIAKSAIAELHRRGEILPIAPQNLVEFRNFATKRVNVNGLPWPLFRNFNEGRTSCQMLTT